MLYFKHTQIKCLSQTKDDTYTLLHCTHYTLFQSSLKTQKTIRGSNAREKMQGYSHLKHVSDLPLETTKKKQTPQCKLARVPSVSLI